MSSKRTGRAATAAILVLAVGAGAALAAPKPRYPTRLEDLPAARPPVTEAPRAEVQAPAPAAEPVRAAPPSGVVTAAPLEPIAATPAPAPEPQPAPQPAPQPEPEPEPEPTPQAKPVTEAKPATKPQIQAKPQAKPETKPKPAPKASEPVELTYKLQTGDTLSGVARRFDVPMRKLMELNALTDAGAVRAGRSLRLPPEACDSGKDPYASGPAVEAPKPKPAAKPQAKPAASEKPKPAATPKPAAAPKPVAAPPAAKPAPATPTVAPAPSSPVPVQPAPAPPTAAPVAKPATKPVVAAPAEARPPLSGFPSDAQLISQGRGRFVWPVQGQLISGFGDTGPGLRNDGLNIAAAQGAPVRAAAAGEVVYAGDSIPGFGNLVLIKHADGWVSAYGHLASLAVRIRDRVAQGQSIGGVGTTGGVDRPQLHFELRYASNPKEKAKPVDPAALLP